MTLLSTSLWVSLEQSSCSSSSDSSVFSDESESSIPFSPITDIDSDADIPGGTMTVTQSTAVVNQDATAAAGRGDACVQTDLPSPSYKILVMWTKQLPLDT